jgi:hypothetical protein
MNTKQQLLSALTEIFNRWQELLASLSEEQITSPLLPSDWSVKDVVAHMWAWQQASLARAEAAVHNREPEYPGWWEINGPDPEEDVDRTNAYLYKINRERAWLGVYTDWKMQFQRYLVLSRQIPELNLFEQGRYAWMGSHTLSASPIASYEHHEEHIDALLAWIREHGNLKTGG